jgi:uncharacterized delta-60 repeat protein
MKKALHFASIMMLFMLPTFCYAQVQLSWVRKYVGSGADNAAGIAADNAGNIYICGNNNWGYNTADMYTIRYNSAGTQTSGLLYNSPYNNADNAKAIATDAAGNVYVAGTVSVNSGTSDIVLIKYNSSAVQQWVAIYNSPQNYIDDVNAIAVDASGNIYLAGSIVTSAFAYDYLTLKFDTGGRLLWSATYNGTAAGVDIASDIAVDGAGNVIVTGLSSGLINRLLGPISTGYDYATIKYSATGVQQWVRTYNNRNSNDEAKSLALDASGNIYVTGSSYAGTDNMDCATLKYATDGTQQWVQRYAGSAAKHDAGNCIAVDGAGNAFVAGYTYNSTGRADVLTIKYNTSGVPIWTGVYDAGSNAHDVGKVCALDVYGNIYIASETSIPGVTSSDFVTLKYIASSGVLSWAARYNGPENGMDYPTAMVVLTPNSGPIGTFQNPVVYLTGISNNDVITLKYSQPVVISGVATATAPAEETSMLRFNVNSYPNPVNKYINIEYTLPSDARVTIAVHDVTGRQIIKIADRFSKAGSFAQRLNTSTLSEGTYFLQFKAQSGDKEFRQSKALVVQR